MSMMNKAQSQMIDDILYLESLIKVDQKNIKQALRTRLQGKNNEEERLDAICDELSFTLSQISARLSIVEKILVSQGHVTQEQHDALKSNTRQLADSSLLVDEVKLPVEDIGSHNYLGVMHHTSNDLPYFALSPSTSVTFELPINRETKKTLAVNIAGVSEHSLLDKTIIKIDGVKLKHKKTTIDGELRLLSHIPASENRSDKTHVELIVPEASKSQQFKFFLSDVYCVPTLSLSSAVKKLLK